MSTIKIPWNTSIIKYITGLISLAILFIIFDAVQGHITNHALDIFFDIFTDPIVFIVWTLYWLFSTFETRSLADFKVAFTIPSGRKWHSEILALLVLSLVFSISLLLITSGVLIHFFPSVVSETTLPLLPENRTLAALCLFFTFVSSVIIKPILEELLFRGVFLSHLNNLYNPLKAMILLSALFAVFHFDPIGAFVFSIVTCLLTMKYNSLFPSVILHIANNFICNVPMVIIQLSKTKESTDALDLSTLPYAVILLIISSILLALYIKTQFSQVLSSNTDIKSIK